MSRRPRPQYRLGLEWILGVAFAYTLTRPVRLAQGLPFVRCCGSPRASSPHGLTAPAPCLTTATTACSCLWLAVATISPREGLSPPIQCPCQAHTRLLRTKGMVCANPRAAQISPARPACESSCPQAIFAHAPVVSHSSRQG